jgi:hypothetical protein
VNLMRDVLLPHRGDDTMQTTTLSDRILVMEIRHPARTECELTAAEDYALSWDG